MGDACAFVVSHRSRRSIPLQHIQNAATRPIYLYPSSAAFGLKRFAPGLAEVLDVLGSWIGRTRVKRLCAEDRPKRIFALVGGNGWFLLVVRLMAEATQLPFDIYLVDDLEDSAALWNRWFLRLIIRRLEGTVLSEAERVFAISNGYVEHLQHKYGQRAQWLPAPMKMEVFSHRPYSRSSPDVRHIIFVGGVSELYDTALIEIYRAIVERNARETDYRLKLLVIASGGTNRLANVASDKANLETKSALPPHKLEQLCSESWATCLPYSFDQRVKNLVSTSFSWKLSDSYKAGRPILVFGPPYASLPRYFREAGLPLCATSPEELRTALDSIEQEDCPELIARYAQTWQRFHSPEATMTRILVD